MLTAHLENCLSSRVRPESTLTFFSVENAQNQIIKNLTILQNKFLAKRVFLNKEAEPKLQIYIRNYINLKNILDLEHVIKNLHDHVLELAASSYLLETGQLDLMKKRLIFLRSVLLHKPNMAIEENNNIFDYIDSDCENNGKEKIKQSSYDEKKNDKSKKNEEKVNYTEEIKNFFFMEAVNVKFSLPPNEKTKGLLISDLYEDAMRKNITVDKFKEYLINRFK